MSPEQAAGCLRTAGAMAVHARLAAERGREEAPSAASSSPLPGRRLVIASAGPYGAFLADGSEYTGDYGTVSDAALREFHASRLRVLVETPGVDGVAFETMPCLREVRIVATLLAEDFPLVPVWFSFSCSDSRTLRSGDPLGDAVRVVTTQLSAQVRLLRQRGAYSPPTPPPRKRKRSLVGEAHEILWLVT